MCAVTCLTVFFLFQNFWHFVATIFVQTLYSSFFIPKGSVSVWEVSHAKVTINSRVVLRNKIISRTSKSSPVKSKNQRLPGACNRSPGSKLLSITTQLHCGCHLGGRAQLPDAILEENHPMTIPSKFGLNWATGSRQDGFYVNFP